jgi:hypothetical protein
VIGPNADSVSVLLGNGLDNFNTRAFEISLN